MARPNKMWWWQPKGEYCITIRGTRHRLGTDHAAAQQKFHELLSAEPEEEPVDPQSVIAIMDTFLDEASIKSDETRKWYQKHCQSFMDFLKDQGLRGLRVQDFGPLYVNRWLKSHTTWSDGTKNGACRAVQRAYRWANQMGYVKAIPIAFVPDKPPPGRRENIITENEYKTILSLVTDEDFKAFVHRTAAPGGRRLGQHRSPSGHAEISMVGRAYARPHVSPEHLLETLNAGNRKHRKR